MKQLVTILLLSVLSIGLFGQEASWEKQKVQHELGINFTYFVKQFLDFGSADETILISPYLISYKTITDGIAFRMGLGGRFFTSTEESSGTSTERVLRDNRLDSRIGLEKQVYLGDKWVFNVGGDVLIDYSNFGSKTFGFSGEVITSTNSLGLGAGPVFGIQFKLTKRVSLFTESRVVYKYSIDNKKIQFVDSPVDDRTEKSSTNRIQFGPPTSLFIAVNF